MITTENTVLQWWSERDRLSITLVDKETEQTTYFEAWDEDAQALFDDGFLPSDAFIMGRLHDSAKLHRALVEYVSEHVNPESDIYGDAEEMALTMIQDEFPNAKILHTSDDGHGTICAVYDVDTARYYHAFEFTYDDGHLSHAMGYQTTDRHHYMGERYRGCDWGEFYPDVYYTISLSEELPAGGELLTSVEDVNWAFDVHIKERAERAKMQSVYIVGNMDAPESVWVCEKQTPELKDFFTRTN